MLTSQRTLSSVLSFLSATAETPNHHFLCCFTTAHTSCYSHAVHVPISQCLLSQLLNSCTPLTTRSACTHFTVPASRPLPTQAVLSPPPQAVVDSQDHFRGLSVLKKTVETISPLGEWWSCVWPALSSWCTVCVDCHLTFVSCSISDVVPLVLCVHVVCWSLPPCFISWTHNCVGLSLILVSQC